jgi:hypothetical protein
MRAIDLALFSDVLCARIAAVEARLERARDRIRQAAIHREARKALPPATIELLEDEGVLVSKDVRDERREIAALAATLTALHTLQRWTEEQLFLAREEVGRAAEPAEAATRGPPRAA